MPELHHGEGEAEQRVLRGLRLAVELSIVILGVEIVGAYFSRSLALTVDAVHNIPDLFAFTLSWAAVRAASKGPTARFTFGTHRVETFAGIANAALVLAAGVAFAYLASSSLLAGAPLGGTVDPYWILAAAIPTLVLRAVNLSFLRRIPGRVRDLNLTSVIVHLASDLAITGALLFAGVVLLTEPAAWWADPIAALGIAGILVFESLPLFREGWDILTERTPRHLSLEKITQRALAIDEVRKIHDVHVWAVCSALICMTAHVEVPNMTLRESMGVVARLRERMEQEFGIFHSTFEVECAS